MTRLIALLVLMLAAPLAALAEEVVAGFSQSRISISTNFDGSELFIYGAVKRETKAPEDSELSVLITVEGPSRPIAVRQKERRFGIWMNTQSVEVDLAPTFYSVSTSGPWSDVILDIEDLRHKISIRRAIRAVGARIAGVENFTNALIRIREREALYQTNIGTVDVTEGTLFATEVRLPANLTEGDYRVRFFLTREGRVIDILSETIPVRKVGLERFLFNLAHDQPLIYGIMSLTIAIAAGWAASAAFRLIRN